MLYTFYLQEYRILFLFLVLGMRKEQQMHFVEFMIKTIMRRTVLATRFRMTNTMPMSTMISLVRGILLFNFFTLYLQEYRILFLFLVLGMRKEQQMHFVEFMMTMMMMMMGARVLPTWKRSKKTVLMITMTISYGD